MSGAGAISTPWRVGTDASAVLAQARDENFPVASRLLPRALRRDLLALYGFARLVDDIGDQAPGNRPRRSEAKPSEVDALAALDAVERDLACAFAGRAEHPILRALEPTLAAHHLSERPFLDLIEANRRDQRVARTESWDELLAYCALSANPVGRLVLGVFDAATPEREHLSDAICSALQVIEHCQDVAEDAARGRCYLPHEDLVRFGCTETDLVRAPAPPALRSVVSHQITRSRALLADGEPLLAELRGFARFAVAGFTAGGHAACDAIERAGFDVTSRTVKASKRARVSWMLRLLLRARRRS